MFKNAGSRTSKSISLQGDQTVLELLQRLVLPQAKNVNGHVSAASRSWADQLLQEVNMPQLRYVGEFVALLDESGMPRERVQELVRSHWGELKELENHIAEARRMAAEGSILDMQLRLPESEEDSD